MVPPAIGRYVPPAFSISLSTYALVATSLSSVGSAAPVIFFPPIAIGPVIVPPARARYFPSAVVTAPLTCASTYALLAASSFSVGFSSPLMGPVMVPPAIGRYVPPAFSISLSTYALVATSLSSVGSAAPVIFFPPIAIGPVIVPPARARYFPSAVVTAPLTCASTYALLAASSFSVGFSSPLMGPVMVPPANGRYLASASPSADLIADAIAPSTYSLLVASVSPTGAPSAVMVLLPMLIAPDIVPPLDGSICDFRSSAYCFVTASVGFAGVGRPVTA